MHKTFNHPAHDHRAFDIRATRPSTHAQVQPMGAVEHSSHRTPHPTVGHPGQRVTQKRSPQRGARQGFSTLAWLRAYRCAAFVIAMVCAGWMPGLSLPARSVAQAQNTVGGSDALIVKAKVDLNVEGAPGTSKPDAEALGRALGGAVSGIQTCYRKMTEDKLDVEGTIRFQVRHRAGVSRLMLRRMGDTTGSAALVRCAHKSLAKVSTRGLSRGTKTVFANLHFGIDKANAKGIKAVKESKDSAPRKAKTLGDGQYEVVSTSSAGQVELRVRSAKSQEHAEATHQGISSTMAMFLDCRRKIAKRVSPEGEIHASLRVSANGQLRASVGHVTVPAPRAAPNPKACTEAALRKAKFETAAAGESTLVVRFSSAVPSHPQ